MALEERKTAQAEPAPESVPASPPRAINRRVKWRSWTEPRVRFWWLLAVVFLAVSAYFLGNGAYTWRHENWLLGHGALVGANVIEVGANGNETGGIKDKKQPPDGRVIANYQVNGQSYQLVGWLKGRTDWIIIGKDVPIHINPADPNDWTGITRPIRLVEEDDFIHGLGVLPIAVILVVVAVWQRQRFVRLWRTGQAVEATVVESRTSAMAPGLRALRCAPAGEGQRRVQRVFGPATLGALAAGDKVWIIRNASERLAVAAAWFE